MSPSKFALCVVTNDFKYIAQKTPGLGAKGAQRIVLELKDKFEAEGNDGMPQTSQEIMTDDAGAANGRADAITALIELGYSRGEATSALASVKENDLTAEEYIRKALAKLF